MKKSQCVKALLLAVVIFCMSVVFSACGGDKTYKVTVKDALGNPYTEGFVVKFMKDGEQAGLQPIDENGVATKELPSGKYTIELNFTDSDKKYQYDTETKVTSRKNEIDVIVNQTIGGEPMSLFTLGQEIDAYTVNAGTTYVELTNEHRNLFVFYPTVSGTYEFSIIGDANVKLGHYGETFFVQDNSTVEAVDNKITVSITDGMIGTEGGGTATYVLGVDALDAEAKSCILAINRTGDPAWTVEDEPWTVYKPTVDLVNYKLPAGLEIKEFDLTASTDTYKFVFNEDDGYYHLNNANGPVVLVRLTEDSDFVDSFETILEAASVTRYFYDDKGEFIKKEGYDECLRTYFECVDEDYGVYPLTEDLKYIIQTYGEADGVGWWNPNIPGFCLFKDVDGNLMTEYNLELGWLVMCCYAE